MKLFLCFIFSFVLFFNNLLSGLSLKPANSFIYYVDSRCGNDLNTGTSPELAWKTLNKVNSQIFNPGDKILFKTGSLFTGLLKPRGSGDKNRPVIIDWYGKGAKPQINAAGETDAALYLYNVEYYEINNLHLSNFGVDRKPKRYGVHIELDNFGTAHHIILKNLDVHDVNGSLVKNEGGGAGIVFTNRGEKVRSRFDEIMIDSCTIRNTARNGILINGNWKRTSWFPNQNVWIRNNLLEGVPGDGIVPIGCDGAVIEHNVMRNSPRLLPDGEAAAGIWPWSCDNTIIQYNEVSGHKAPWDGQGFDSDWNCRNTIIQYNYSHDNEGGFLLICNDGSSKMPVSAGNKNTVVRYNLSVNDGFRTVGKHAGFSPVIHISGPVQNTSIYNNVIYVSGRIEKMDSTLIQMSNWSGIPDSTFFVNNIFYVKGLIDYNLRLSKDTFFENNLYFGTHLNRPCDTGAVIADPMFVNQPGSNSNGFQRAQAFILRKGSPAIHKGQIINQQLVDFFGNMILPQQMPNIGIYQGKN